MRLIIGTLLVVSALCSRAIAEDCPVEKPDEHYLLQRNVYRIELSGSPRCRVLCTVRDETQGSSDVVIWDPEDRHSNVRYALLPSYNNVEPVWSCRSEPRTLETKDGVATVIGYDPVVPSHNAETSPPPNPRPMQSWSVDTTPTLELKAFGIETKPADLTISVAMADELETKKVLERLSGTGQLTRLRSLDPTTVINDLLSTLAMVALSRGEAAAKEYTRDLISDVCSAVKVGNIIDKLGNSPLSKALVKLNWEADRSLLENTCRLVENLRLDELVSAHDAIAKAIGADANILAAALLQRTLEDRCDQSLGRIAFAAGGLLASALANGSTNTERDAQVLLLELARVGGVVTSGRPWRRDIELGMAVLTECLRAGDCPADELDRLLRQEVELLGEGGATLLADWPTLPSLLGRAATVMRPPPGTPPAVTAAASVTIVLEVIEHALKQSTIPIAQDVAKTLKLGSEPRYQRAAVSAAIERVSAQDATLDEAGKRLVDQARQSLETLTAVPLMATLRGFAEVLRGGDMASAVVAFQRVLKEAIFDHCAAEKGSLCRVPLTDKQLTRGFKVLAAIATYSSSYREQKGDQPAAEQEKQRMDDRKKAIESLIDAMTDRAQRKGDVVVSFGTNVALGLDLRVDLRSEATRETLYVNTLPLSLKTGIAIQRLPGESAWNGHVMFSVLDLAQYATIKQDVVAKLRPIGALSFGVEADLLFGKPSVPIALTVYGRVIPRVKYEDKPRAEYSTGLSLGTFVPFIDFN